MLQKKKITAWMLLKASLIVMSVFISCFATSATRTYAQPQANLPNYPIDVKVFRAFSSTVGCVVITKVTDPVIKGGDWEQVPLPTQNILVAANHTYNSEDRITIKSYPDGQCQDGSGTGFFFDDKVRRLPHNCGHPANANPCRDYETPPQA